MPELKLKMHKSDTTADRSHPGLPSALALVLLLLATVALFYPAASYDFVRYDETDQLLDNPLAWSLSRENIHRIFTSFAKSSYYPVRMLSFAIERRFFGFDPHAYHVTSIVLHVLNILLLYSLILRLYGCPTFIPSVPATPPAAGVGLPSGASASDGGQRSGLRGQGDASANHDSRFTIHIRIAAALAAATFALHPLVVEPVVWVSGREELLALLFTLLCLHAYIAAFAPGEVVSHQSARRKQQGLITDHRSPITGHLSPIALYICAVACAALASMSNVMGAVIAFILTSYELAVRRRVRPSTRSESAGGAFAGRLRAALLSLLLLLPFWAMSVATVVLKKIGDTRADSLLAVAPDKLRGLERAATVCQVYAQNVRSLIWPHPLCLMYPDVRESPHYHLLLISGLALVTGTIFLLWLVRRRRLILFGLLWFLLGMAPSSQVMTHHIIRADRFFYIPLGGLLLALASAVILLRRTRAFTWALTAWLVATAALGVRARLRLPAWRDGHSLFTSTLDVNPKAYVAWNNLGNIASRQGDTDLALQHYTNALEAEPNYPFSHNNIGAVLSRQGKLSESRAHYEQAIRLFPGYYDAHQNIAQDYMQLGDLDPALYHFRVALRIRPGYGEAHVNMGDVLMRLGKLKEAAKSYEQAIRLRPRYAQAFNKLGLLLSRAGNMQQAASFFAAATRAAPNYTEAHMNLGDVLLASRRVDEARAAYEAAVNANRTDHRARNKLAMVLAQQGQLAQALWQCNETIRINPRFPYPYNNIGSILCQQGKHDEATAYYEKAMSLDPTYSDAHVNYLRLQVILGQPGKGVERARAALESNPDSRRLRRALAWVLSTHEDPAVRDGAEALQLARAAAEGDGAGDPRNLDTLAAAFAELGRLDDAVKTAKQAQKIAQSQNSQDLAAEIAERLVLYERGEPWRRKPPGPNDASE